MEYLYRYQRALCNDWTDAASVTLVKFKVLRETPGGHWIRSFGKEKWVSKYSTKRFAYPTPEEAFTNFKKRTERCVKILASQLESAKSYVAAIKNNTLKIYESSFIPS
jgi:hypothetical protein